MLFWIMIGPGYKSGHIRQKAETFSLHRNKVWRSVAFGFKLVLYMFCPALFFKWDFVGRFCDFEQTIYEIEVYIYIMCDWKSLSKEVRFRIHRKSFVWNSYINLSLCITLNLFWKTIVYVNHATEFMWLISQNLSLWVPVRCIESSNFLFSYIIVGYMYMQFCSNQGQRYKITTYHPNTEALKINIQTWAVALAIFTFLQHSNLDFYMHGCTHMQPYRYLIY